MFLAASYAPQEDSNNKGTYIYSAWTDWVPHRNENPKIKINIILFPSRILGNRKAYNLHHWTMRIHNHTSICKRIIIIQSLQTWLEFTYAQCKDEKKVQTLAKRLDWELHYRKCYQILKGSEKPDPPLSDYHQIL